MWEVQPRGDCVAAVCTLRALPADDEWRQMTTTRRETGEVATVLQPLTHSRRLQTCAENGKQQLHPQQLDLPLGKHCNTQFTPPDLGGPTRHKMPRRVGRCELGLSFACNHNEVNEE